MFRKLCSNHKYRRVSCQEVIMKSLAIVIISSVFLSGCAHYGYQRSYAGYGGEYRSAYGVQSSYAYPASGYYPQQTVRPSYPRAYSPPRKIYGGRHDDWNAPRRDRHDDIRVMERRLDRQQHAIRQGIRSGDLTRREAERLKQDVRKIDRQLDHVQRRPIVSRVQRNRLEQDLNRSRERIRQFKTNDLTNDGRWRDRDGGRNRNR